MNDRPTLQELIEVQQQLGLPDPALVEKDWFVVKALAAIIAADKGPFELIFQGGTALSRAHRVTKRMSEDIDIKIVSKGPPSRRALRRLRERITAELHKAGFKFDPKNPKHLKSNYEGRYTLYQLPYEPIAAGQGALRPEIKIETSVWPMRRPSSELPVSSFVAEAFKREPEVPAIATAAIPETAAEKFVALTRRAGAELAGLTDRARSDAGAPHLRPACDRRTLRSRGCRRAGARRHAVRRKDLWRSISRLSG